MNKTLRDAIYGLAVGDALGVPYEFNARDTFNCTTMTGYGTWQQPAGTWSDDTSMTLATCKSIKATGTIDLHDIMRNFIAWYRSDAFTANNHRFDIGGATQKALDTYDGTNPLCGGTSPMSNGNGSLMRIIPLAFTDATDEDIANVSRLTHAHEISIDCCIKYIHLARSIIQDTNPIFKYELPIRSGGYVVDTFNAAMYCLDTTTSYQACVLKAVNLGDDTDTTAAVAGALAGLLYGFDSIPKDWIQTLRNKQLIEDCLF